MPPRLDRSQSSAADLTPEPSRFTLCCLQPLLNPERDDEFYRLLGVERDATAAQIKKAYRKISLAQHPDKLRQKGVEVTPELRQQFVRTKEAYECLGDARRRKVYDHLGELGLKVTENPSSVGQDDVMRTMSHMTETTRCAILLVVLSVVGFFGLLFPVLLSTNVDHKTDVPWAVVFLPVWVIDALILVNHLGLVCQGGSGGGDDEDDVGGAPPGADDDDGDFGDDDFHGGAPMGDVPLRVRLFHLGQFLLLVIFQVLVVWMLSTPSNDRSDWGAVFLPLFVHEALALCSLLPGACAQVEEPSDDEAPLHPDPDVSRELRQLRHAQELNLRSMHRRAVMSLLFRVLQELLIALKLSDSPDGAGDMSWWLVFLPVWLYCLAQFGTAALLCAASQALQASIDAPEGATDDSWMTDADRMKAAAAQETGAAGFGACCTCLCVFLVGALVAAKAQDWDALPAIAVFAPLLAFLGCCFCCTCVLICGFRPIDDEDDLEAPAAAAADAAPPVAEAPSPQGVSPLVAQAAAPAPPPSHAAPPADDPPARWPVKRLKATLVAAGVPLEGLVEKGDYVAAVERLRDAPSVPPPAPPRPPAPLAAAATDPDLD